MKILFVHQNFPGQFKHLAPALAADPAHTVVALTMQPSAVAQWQGVQMVSYRAQRGSTPGIHPWLIDMETKTIRAEAAMRAAIDLRGRGFHPDVIIAHPGWGESLFLKEVWPQARLGAYCEFYYHAHGVDVGFDPEFAVEDVAEAARLRLKNVNNLLHFDQIDAAMAPTHWQASTFPMPFRERIEVVHDGIDTVAIAPNPQVAIALNGQIPLTRSDEVITFVSRNLEPYRGYHTFMRALPRILRDRPKARVLLVGGDDVSYGARPPGHQSWKQIFATEVRPLISDADWQRVHFLGHVPYEQFLAVLHVSTVHVYLTYPFVLSWSLLEAMSAGCAIVASDTQPVKEAIVHGETGRLVDFFDPEGLAREVCALADDPQARRGLGGRARAFAQAHYDLRTACLPRQLRWVHDLAR
ncbi:glycosyltransferase involved in cell wall biosynthesis [Acidovorax delafieldii]|uniref:glycosyltransferase n=1 Tax=Acidovorax delafieldii TaxID=47920 RepID=UPI002860F0D3|nr:glycosyltransferase [Acidovorax delafieldii]MDR6155129.1 glycosyltransferase involved in cell wall biosynthesis [Acidovorax delafieldii]